MIVITLVARCIISLYMHDLNEYCIALCVYMFCINMNQTMNTTLYVIIILHNVGNKLLLLHQIASSQLVLFAVEYLYL